MHFYSGVLMYFHSGVDTWLRSGHLAAIELLSLSPTDGHFQSLGKTSYPRFADGLSMLESGH